jgi:hypothetical protein
MKRSSERSEESPDPFLTPADAILNVVQLTSSTKSNEHLQKKEGVSKGRNPLTAKNAKNIAKNAKD